MFCVAARNGECGGLSVGSGVLHQERGGRHGTRSSVSRGEQRVRVIVQRRSYPPLSPCQWAPIL